MIEQSLLVRLCTACTGLANSAMSTTAFDNLLNSLRDGGNKAADAVRDNKEIAVGVGAAVAVLGAWRAYSSGSGKYRRKPGAFELSGGSIDRKKIDHTFKDYSASYGKEAGAGITDRQRTTELVGLQPCCPATCQSACRSD
jgi:hypothetical protein